MGNYNLNSIMARINHIDVQEKMVQNQDVSLFINRYLKIVCLHFNVFFFYSCFIISRIQPIRISSNNVHCQNLI